jgi:hypothetical protein
MSLPTKGDEFTCAMCGEKFFAAGTREEAMAELEYYFGSVPEREIEVICDPCYEKIHPADHPEEVERAKRETNLSSRRN